MRRQTVFLILIKKDAVININKKNKKQGGKRRDPQKKRIKKHSWRSAAGVR